MAQPGGELYKIAVGQFKLKDGIVRHLKDDIKRFKPTYRAAEKLTSMAGELN
jgi:hypothetical protein